MELKKRPLLIVFSTVIVAAILVAIILINFYLDSFVKDRITKQVYESSQGLYSVQINELHTQFWTGTVTMENVLLSQDRSKLKELQRERPNENISTIKLNIPSLQIHRIRWINYLISNDLKVGKIYVRAPEMAVNGSTFSETMQETNKKFIELLPAIIAGFAGSLRIEKMIVESGKLKYDIETQEKIITQTADSIFIDLNDIIIDTIPRKKILYSEDIHFGLSNYRLKTSDELYALSINKISGAFSDSILQFEKVNYYKQDSINKDEKETEVFIKSIIGERVSFRDLLYNKKIFIGKLLLESPQINSIIYRRYSNEKVLDSIRARGKSGFFVSPFISHIVESFTINDIQANNGTVQNKTYTYNDVIFQNARNVNLRILKIAGVISNSLQIKSPDHINISFNNYELQLGNPEIKITIKRAIASSFDSTIYLHDSRIYYKDERVNSKKTYLNNSAQLVMATGFDLHALLDNNKVSLEKIFLTNPRTEFKMITKKDVNKKPNSVRINFGSLIDSLNVDRIEINNGSFIHEAIISGDSIIHQSKKYNLTIQEIYAVSNEIPDVSDIWGEFKDYELKLVNEKMVVLAELVFISSQKQDALVKNLRINQYHPLTKEENVFNTTIPEFRINQFDLKRALYKSEVAAEVVMVNNMKMNVFFKEGKVLKPDYAKKMPNEMARAIPFYLKIDTVNFNNAEFTFMEKKNASIVFTLNKTKASIFNLSNDKKTMTMHNPAKLIGETMLLGQGKISFTISVPLLSSKFDCSYNGKIGLLKAETLNNIFSYAEMKAEKGQIDSGSFVLNVSDGVANGNLKLVYHDFQIKVLDSIGKEKRIKSKIGNFVIKNSNPKHKNEEPEIVQIGGTREPDDSIFSMLWRPLKEGVIKTVTKDTFVGDYSK